MKIQEKLMKEHYPNDIETHPNTYHQYIGEYLANKTFMVEDKDILNSIKYHTTGRAKMSLLEKNIINALYLILPKLKLMELNMAEIMQNSASF